MDDESHSKGFHVKSHLSILHPKKRGQKNNQWHNRGHFFFLIITQTMYWYFRKIHQKYHRFVSSLIPPPTWVPLNDPRFLTHPRCFLDTKATLKFSTSAVDRSRVDQRGRHLWQETTVESLWSVWIYIYIWYINIHHIIDIDIYIYIHPMIWVSLSQKDNSKDFDFTICQPWNLARSFFSHEHLVLSPSPLPCGQTGEIVETKVTV